MSGICGIFNPDGKPVPVDLLRDMADAAAYRGPDGIRYHLQDYVGLAYLALNVTLESTGDQQPLVHEQGQLVLTADARIDGRPELMNRLGSEGIQFPAKPSDANLILAAYRCWGADCVQYLLGDFAFVIWDGARQRLFAARDQVGARPFYYRYQSGTFQWATEASQLLVDPAFPIEINEVMVARDLALPGRGGLHQSYYVGIHKLGPAEMLLVDPSGLRRRRYWDFDPNYQLRYRDDSEYVAHFADLFHQVVYDRLRSTSSVGLFLSGGLDSTAIASVAAVTYAEDTTGEIPPLEAVNWTFKQMPRANETRHSRAVAQRHGFTYHEFEADSVPPIYDFPNEAPHRDEPFTLPWHAMFVGTLRHFSGPRVWMTGVPGDVIGGINNPFFYLDLLRQGRPGQLVDRIRAHAQMWNLPPKTVAWNFFLEPLLWQPVKKAGLRPMKRYVAGRVRPKEIEVHSHGYLAPELVRRTNLSPWLQEKGSELDYVNWNNITGRIQWPNAAKDWRYRSIVEGRHQRTRLWFDRLLAGFQADGCEPWSDIRLAQFALAVPEEELAQGLDHKLMHRKAMRGILPDGVRRQHALRIGPAYYSRRSLQQAGPQRLIQQLMSDSAMVRMGFVEEKKFEKRLETAATAPEGMGFGLWMAISLEMWLQTHLS